MLNSAEGQAMVVAMRPHSAQSNRFEKYQETLRANWVSQVGDGDPFGGDELYVHIVWFHSGEIRMDLDNIAKRILDALKGLAFGDDAAVARCILEKVLYTQREFQIVGNPPVVTYENLLRLLGEQHPDILYIEAGAISPEVRQIPLGP